MPKENDVKCQLIVSLQPKYLFGHRNTDTYDILQVKVFIAPTWQEEVENYFLIGRKIILFDMRNLKIFIPIAVYFNNSLSS